MPFQTSEFSSLGDAGGSGAPVTALDVTDGAGIFRVFSNGNIQLTKGPYPNVGQTWTPTSKGYNDVVKNLISANPDNRPKMERVMGTTAVSKALAGSTPAAPKPIVTSAAPQSTALPAPVGSGSIANYKPGASTETTSITQEVWFWPAMAIVATGIVGGGIFAWYKWKEHQESAVSGEDEFHE